MAELLARLNVSSLKDVTIVEFTELRILDETQIEQIGSAMKGLISGEHPKLLIDFSGVDGFSSAALGMLVDVNSTIKQKNGQLRLCNVSPRIMQAFTLTRLDRVLRISGTREGAMEILCRSLDEKAAKAP